MIRVTAIDVLRHEIQHGTQRSVGVIYGLCLPVFREGELCKEINRAIISRWSMSGLERVKKIAFDVYEGLTKERQS